MNTTRFLKIAFAMLFVLTSFAVRAATITVFAAASLTDSLKEIGRDYQARTGDKVEFNFAGSSTLERQIAEGAPADIFFSADEAKMDALEKKGLVDTKTRRNRLSNSLVIVVGADSQIEIRSPKALATGSVTRLALADPQAVPSGIYAREYLTKIHLWTEIEPKVVRMENVRAALAAVESGDAQAGIVYKTDAAISKKTRVAFEVPREEGPRINYPVALLKDAPQPKAAGAFLEYLNSESAGRVFLRFGFILDHTLP